MSIGAITIVPESSSGDEMKKLYRIPLLWQMYGYVDVEASSLEEAITYAVGPDCPLPDGDYVDDSIALDSDVLDLMNSEEM